MPIPKITYQLPLALDLPEPEDGGLGEDVRLKSEAARKGLEGMYGKVGSTRWLDEYLELIKGGWPWRSASLCLPGAEKRLSHVGFLPGKVSPCAEAWASWSERNPLTFPNISIYLTI